MRRNPQDAQQLSDDRRQVREWLRDGAASVLVMPRREGFAPRHVLWPTVYSRIRQNLKSAAVLLINKLPVSSPKVFFYRRLGMKIGPGVYISPGVVIDAFHPELITLENGCILGYGCRLFTHEITAKSYRLGRVRVRKGAVVGGFATVRSGVTIGAGATVGFNSFVNRDVPEGVTVGGVPARPLTSSKEDD